MIARQRKRRHQRKLIYEIKQSQNNSIQKQCWNNRKDAVNFKRRQSYMENPSPKRRKVNQAYSNNPSPVRDRKKQAYHANPSPIRHRIKEAYHKNPSPVCHRIKEAYHKNPSPVCHRIKEAYHKNPSPVRNRIKEAYRKNPSPERNRIKEACRKNPSPVRHRIKEAYRKDPSPVRHRIKEAYHKNPSPVRHRIKEAYHKKPSPVCHRVKEAYHKNPSPVCHRVRHKYNQNTSPVKKRVRKAYQSNPSPVRKRARLAYADNPSPIKKRVLRKYHEHSSPFKERSKRYYHADVATSRLLQNERYAKDPRRACNRSRLYYIQHQDKVLEKALHRRHTTLAALNVRNKYNKMFGKSYGRSGTFTKFFKRLTTKIGVRNIAANELKAQLLVRSCLQQLSLCKHKFTTSFEKLQNKITASISKAKEVATTDLEMLDVLCGGSLHTSNSELYNCGACYNSEAFNEDGLLDFEKFPNCEINYIGDKCFVTWECCLDPPLCKLDGEVILSRLHTIYSKIVNCSASAARQYMEHMDDCTNIQMKDTSLQGHPLNCYLSSPPCTSDLLYLRILAPHFPTIRSIVMAIYEVWRNNTRILEIERALQYGHLDKVLDIVQEARTTRLRQYDVSTSVLNEQDIYETYKKSFSKLYETCQDVPKYPCISCDKLCYQRDCSHMDRLRIVPSNRHWENLLEFTKTRPCFDDGLPNGYICDYCLRYFRSDKLPPRCILNGLDFGVVPKEIQSLNTYERILIQRAKCFQTVTRMGTVAKKHLPSSYKVQKVHGTTFHLPLPLQETLKRLPEPQQPLPDAGQLYILLRSIPSKKK